MNQVLIDGQWDDAPLARDRGLFYGDGLFETIAVIEGQMPMLELHLRRLKQGCERLYLPPPDEALLRDELMQVAASGPSPAIVKLIYTRGAASRGYPLPETVKARRLLYRFDWPSHPSDWWRQGIVVRVCELRLAEQPFFAGLKTLNRLEQVMARAEWHDTAIQEGIMLDQQGKVIEGTMSNVFAVKAGELSTPSLEHCGVAGVMREKVIEITTQKGIPCHITRLGLDDLKQADEVFMTNSVIGIWPVRDLAGTSLGPGPFTRELQSVVSQFVSRHEVSHI
jgi:4-amino-4-deoxychorismate lyase